MTLELRSPAFNNGQGIPSKYSCRGQGISPALNWNGMPTDTKSIALIMDDPDAQMGTFVHWVIFNIPASLNHIAEAIPAKPHPGGTLSGAAQGTNSSGTSGYTGPCPPSGTHRYFFKLYCLDQMLDLVSTATKVDLLDRMQGHILAHAELMGTFQK